MGFTRFIAVAGAVVFALWAAPAVHGAGAVFKCQGPGGKLTFSDQPCVNEQKQETVKAAPVAGAVDVRAACGTASRTAADPSAGSGVCQKMRTCAENKGHPSCLVYCSTFTGSDSLLAGVKFGPTSPSCMHYNAFVGGRNWVQTEPRVSSGAAHDVFPASCVDESGRIKRPVRLVCNVGTTNCATEAPLRGRRLIATPIDELLAKTCGA
ncbi:MAG: hypothetical protein K0R58_449 [Ramlibacter sp.]|nr:hypothetical protein [Ramlibacter sp.]